MALPKLEIEISADPTAADVGFKKIERSLDGLEKATRDYQVALNKINAAEKAGVITSNAAAKAVRGAEQAYQSAAKAAAQYSGAQVNMRRVSMEAAQALDQVSTSSRFGSSQLQNIGFQVGDFATQVGAGTSAAQALGQQLPQLLGGFGAVGAVMGAVAAIGIPLGAALLSVGSEAKTLEDRLGELEEIMSALKEPTDILAMSAKDLGDKYGEAAQRVKDFAVLQAELEVAAARSALREQVTILQDAADAYTTAQNAGRDYRNTLNRIERDFGLTGVAAQEFESLLEDVATAGDFEQQQAALQKVAQFLDDAGIKASDIPPEVAAALAEMIRLSNATDAATAATNSLSDAASGVVSEFSQAAIEAGRVAAALNQARTSGRYSGRGGDPRQFDTDGRMGGGFVPSEDIINQANDILNPPASRGSRGGGRQEQPDRIGALAQSLMSESELLENWRTESMAKLEEFNQLELEALGGHNEAKLRLEEEYQDRLKSIHDAERKQRIDAVSGALGDVATLMQSENKKIFAIGKAASIANATVKGYEAAVDAWDKGMKIGGPPVAAAFTAASLAKTGALISNIASQQVGGGGSGAPSGGGGGATAAPAIPTQTVSINLQGDTFSRGSVEGLLEQIQSQLDRGGRLVFS